MVWMPAASIVVLTAIAISAAVRSTWSP